MYLLSSSSFPRMWIWLEYERVVARASPYAAHPLLCSAFALSGSSPMFTAPEFPMSFVRSPTPPGCWSSLLWGLCSRSKVCILEMSSNTFPAPSNKRIPFIIGVMWEAELPPTSTLVSQAILVESGVLWAGILRPSASESGHIREMNPVGLKKTVSSMPLWTLTFFYHGHLWPFNHKVTEMKNEANMQNASLKIKDFNCFLKNGIN